MWTKPSKTVRTLDGLLPEVRIRAALWMDAYRARTGLSILLTCTFRSAADQLAAYRSGASNAKPGFGWHEYGCAVDGVPLVGGKPLWTTHDKAGKMLSEWAAFGATAKDCGLEWAGDWKSFVEYGHVQHTFGFTIKQVQANPDILKQHY